MSDHSITQWIQGLRGGDEQAAEQIWRRFFERLCRLAERRIGRGASQVTDPEDIALSAIHALCDGARKDRFARLDSREDLWALLAIITVRKVLSSKRAAGRRLELRESELEVELDHLMEGRPTAALTDDDYLESLSVTTRELLEQLDENLRETAVLRLQGLSHAEIAARIGKSVPSVERYLRMVRHAFLTP